MSGGDMKGAICTWNYAIYRRVPTRLYTIAFDLKMINHQSFISQNHLVNKSSDPPCFSPTFLTRHLSHAVQTLSRLARRWLSMFSYVPVCVLGPARDYCGMDVSFSQTKEYWCYTEVMSGLSAEEDPERVPVRTSTNAATEVCRTWWTLVLICHSII